MFAATMEDREICRNILERAIGIPIREVRIRSEAALLVNSDYRGVRLDVYAADENGSVFDVEMQTTDKHNLPKRSRAYQGQMDMVALKPGEDFNQLPTSFIIFICTYDPFGQKRYRYTFTPRCHETGEALDDGTCRIFLNTKGEHDAEVPAELVTFLKYIEDSSYVTENSSDSLIQKIDAKIMEIKRDRGMEVQYMLFSEMLHDEEQKGQDRVLRLMNLMEADGNADKIPKLWKDSDFLREMYSKYHIEA